MNESLRTVDGRQVLRIERRLTHRPEKVWRAVTEPAHLSQWYPFTATDLDLRVGGTIRFDDGQGTTFTAVVTELDPPRVFAFSERPPESMPRESDDLVHIELHPDDDGCLLVFTHVFDDRPAAASYATGWSGCLTALALVLDEKPVDLPPTSIDLYESFVRAFGLAEGSVETTADGWRVRYERQLMRQPVEAVWALLTGAADPAVGDPPPPASTLGEARPGVVTAVEAPTLLEYAWPRDDRPAGRVRWELSPGPGGARVVLTQSATGQPSDPSPASAAEACRTHVERLVERLLSGRV